MTNPARIDNILYPKIRIGLTAMPSPDETPIGSGATTEPTKVNPRKMNIPAANSAVDKGCPLILFTSSIPGVNLSRSLTPTRPREKHMTKVAKLRIRTHPRSIRNTEGSSQAGGGGI
jgi:hypothetical protein